MSKNFVAIRNFLCGLCSYLFLHYGYYEVPSHLAAIFAVIIWFGLSLQTAISGIWAAITEFKTQTIPELFKGELRIEPNFGALMEHPVFKDYYSAALPLYENRSKQPENSTEDEEDDFQGNDKSKDLWSKGHFRFVFIGGQIWSDFESTFTNCIRFQGKILATDLPDGEKEPWLRIHLTDGVLKMELAHHRHTLKKDNSQKICEFPLFIFSNIPMKLLEFQLMKKQNFDRYIEIRKGLHPVFSLLWGWTFNVKTTKASYKLADSTAKEFGFERYSNGESDHWPDSEGNVQSYDPNDGFVNYQSDFLTVRFKELDD